jgi:pilus assembly protein CpaF
MEIVEVLSYDTEKRKIIINPLYEFRESKESTKNKVVGQLARTENPMQNVQKLENAGIDRVI